MIVDKFINRLEESGLCLPSKGAALRRWIRILPDGEPFIQTLISYFKLNYAKGRVTEAKAYLEQSPYIHHHYFSHYERPVRMDMELTDGKTVLPEETALARIRECKENRVPAIRFYGGENYEPLERILQACKAADLRVEIVLFSHQKAKENACVAHGQEEKPQPDRSRLAAMVEAGADSFLIDLENDTDKTALTVLAALQEMGAANVRARWFMYSTNAGKLAAVVNAAEACGAKELIVTGMKSSRKANENFPSREQIAAAAEFIKDYCKLNDRTESTRENGNREVGSDQTSESIPQQVGMQIVVGSCFSPLRAYMEGEDPKRNGNRGIERGCEAGRSFMALRADGSFTPCLYWTLENAGSDEGSKGLKKLTDYWEHSQELQVLREKEEDRPSCAGCCYERRCLPCLALKDSACCCPLHRY